MRIIEMHRMRYPEPFRGFYFTAHGIAGLAYGRVAETGQPAVPQEKIGEAIERALTDAYLSGKLAGAREAAP